LNEFEEMEELLVGAFPTVFLLGQAYGSKGLMKPNQMEHLLMQHTNAAATNRELLFFLFDVKSRHSIVHNFYSAIKNDSQAFGTYSEFVGSSEFADKIKQAARNPTSQEAKEVLQEVLPVLSLGTKNNFLAGALGDTTSVSRGMAQAKRYGPASVFLTGTPDDINDPSIFRLACGVVDNKDFPAETDDEFFQKLHENSVHTSKGNIRFPLDYTSRTKSTTRNPVAVAHQFRAMVENLLEILVGCPLQFKPGTNSGKKRTWYFKSRAHNSPHHKGVFGNIQSFFGCIETQARGSLHFHIVIWGGLTPELLEKAAPFSDICAVIQDALDKMHCSSLPREVHAADMLIEKMKETKSGREKLPHLSKVYSASRPASLPSRQQEWKNFMWHNVLRTGIHKHTFTCKKPPSGVHRCRGAYPNECVNKTRCCYLEVNEEELQQVRDKEKSLSEVLPAVSTKPILPLPSPQKRDMTKVPVPPTDDRLIIWELQRPKLKPLPKLPEKFRRAVDNAHNLQEGKLISKSHELGPTRSASLSETEVNLVEAKEFCIGCIEACLGEDASANGKTLVGEAAPNIVAWLKTLSPLAVAEVYDSISSDLPTRNGIVVATSMALSNATSSSINSVLLGNAQQSASALFYVIPYVCKNKVAMEACLVALEAAQKHVQKHTSRAADSGTSKRYVQHLFTRVLNNLSKCMQVSDTQVALSLLNMGTELTSDTYKYFGVHNCVNYVLHDLAIPSHNIAKNDIEAEVSISVFTFRTSSQNFGKF